MNALAILSSHPDIFIALNQTTMKLISSLLFTTTPETQGLVVFILLNLCKLQASYWLQIQGIRDEYYLLL